VPDLVAGITLAALVLYALLGGADYGGGVWDLLASGPRAAAQRALVAEAIGPVWEANHVWLILVVVVLFAAFPPAFAAITTALHVPVTLMLLGIVFRGAAFAFRAYDPEPGVRSRLWARLFAVASLLVPVLLGVTVGSIATGRVLVRDGAPVYGFVLPWLAAFPFAVGALTLALFAHLAAVYLTVEADEPSLRDDFRRRALFAQVAVAATALLTYLLAEGSAPLVYQGLTASRWAWPLQIVTGTCALGGVAALVGRRFRVGRVFAAGQVACIVVGWAAAQYPYLVPPALTIAGAAAPPAVLGPLLVALASGVPLLVPSLGYLFWVFKRQRIGVTESPPPCVGGAEGSRTPDL
jgi:cytochrome d ubiquinol oxidase subunit II